MLATVRNGLFISEETINYIEELPFKKKLMLREFINQIKICEKINTIEAKDALWNRIEQWENALYNPYLNQLFNLLDEYMAENLSLKGDLSRCYVQILEVLDH